MAHSYSWVSGLRIVEGADGQIPDCVGKLVQLERLDAYKNQISEVTERIGALQTLKELNIFNNQLATLPAAVSELEALELLNVASNQLVTLPPLKRLRSLKRLALFWNKSCPPSARVDMCNGRCICMKLFMQIQRQVYADTSDVHHSLVEPPVGLTRMRLLCVRLPEVPELGNKPELEELQLSKNLIDELPDLAGLPALTSISVGNNNLRTIPASISACTALQELAAGSNLIEALPLGLAGLPDLSKVSPCLTKLMSD
jgi:Leucine-rich repeat (LRR) protein